MKIRLVFEAQLREAAGEHERLCDIDDGSTVLSVLDQQIPDGPLRDRVFDGDKLQSSLLLFVNDQPVPSSEVESRVCVADDVVLLLPPISGG